MIKKNLLFLCALIFGLFQIIIGCKKSETANASSFTWTYKDTSNVATLHRAYQASMASTPIITATKGTSLRSYNVSIGISSFSPGNYVIGGGSPNAIYFVDVLGNSLLAASGSVTITAYSGSLISGNFSAIVNDLGGVPRTLTGAFVNTSVEP